MIVVDTSVWVDFFRGRSTAQTRLLSALIEDDAGVAITDVVLAELLQGVDESDADDLERSMRAFDVFRLEDLADFTRAAGMTRAARDAGQAVGRTVDCLIASACVREGVSILHADADFDRLAGATDLEVVPV